MKNKILILLFLLFTFLIIGCEKNNDIMYIDCDDEIVIQSVVNLKVYYNNEKIDDDNLQWTISDYNIVNIIDGKLYAKGYGNVTIGVIDNNNNYCAKEITIIEPYVTDIIISGPNEMKVNKTIYLEAKVLPEIIESEVIWTSSNEDVAVVDNGEVYSIGLGVVDIIATCDEFEKRYTITVIPEPTFIEIIGENQMSINELLTFTYNIEDEVILESSNNAIAEVVDNAILGKDIGTVVITAYKKSDPSVKGTIEVTVDGKLNNIEMTTEELIQIEEIINSMTIEQLIGQMFNVGIGYTSNNWEVMEIEQSTGLPYAQFSRNDPKISVVEYFKQYNIGNFTIKNAIGTSRNNLIKAVNTLTKLGKDNCNVNPFITIEYAGGNTMNALNTLPSNLSLATASNNTISSVSNLFASELNAIGINTVLNIYANTNPRANNLLTTYGDNISKAITTASLVNNSYKNNNIVMIPDLSISGNTADDRPLEQLYNSDFKLLEASIQNGAQIISLPLAQYSNYGGTYAFKNPSFINDYIRSELNYDGVLMIDNSVMTTFVYEGTLNNDVVEAINNGVDMINFDVTFTLSRWSDYNFHAQQYIGVYNHVLQCAKDGTISQDRIREAVARILLVKLRNNILKDKQETEFNYDKVKDQLLSYMPSFISTVGDMYQIDKNDNVLFLSENHEATSTSNSLGDNFNKYTRARGYGGIKVYHTNTLRPEDILNSASAYNKIFISVDYITNSKKIGYAANAMNYLQFIDQLRVKNKNICFIFTGNSDVKDYFDWLENYILLYDFYEDDFESLCRVLTQEAEPNRQ